MSQTIIRPRCPNCGKVVAEMILGKARFTCPRCKVKFEISTQQGKYDAVLDIMQN